MKKKSKKTTVLMEEKTFGSSASKVDREAGIIRGVKVLGTTSENAVPGTNERGYTYNKTARAQMATLCEGIVVNIDHPDRKNPTASRSIRDRFGKLVDLQEKPDGVYADLHYLKSHPMAESVCEAAERMPEVFGLSPVAYTQIAQGPNGYVVEGVERVRSVDVVGKPATNATLFEGKDEESMADQQITYGEIFKDKPKILAVLKEDLGDMTDMPMEGATAVAEVNPDEAIKSAFRTAVVAAFDDDKMDTPTTVKRIKDILKAYDKLQEEPEKKTTPPSTEKKEGDSSAEENDESKKDKPPTAEELQEEMKVRDELWEKGVKPTGAMVKSLLLLEDKDERAELLAILTAGAKKTTTPSKTPRSGFMMEDDDEGERKPEKERVKAFAANVRD